MPNTLLTPTEITREALYVLHNNMALAKHANRSYDDRFARDGAKIGSTLQVRKPAEFTVGTGADITSTIQDYVEQKEDLVVSTQKNVAITFSSSELTLSVQDFSERILGPAMARLASDVDNVGCQTVITSAYNEVGTPGTTPGTSKVWLDAGAVLDSYTAPRDKGRRVAVLNPQANADTVEGLKGLFSDSSTINKQFKSGMMSDALGLLFDMDQNINTLTTGTRNTAYLTNEAGGVANGDTTLAVDTGAGTATVGEIFTITGIWECNPETKVNTGRLKQFMVTALYTPGGAGTVSISPTIYISGARQNIVNTNAAATWDNLAITFRGSASQIYPVNFAFHRDAIALVTADLEDVSQFGAWGSRQVEDGISLRIARQYNVLTDAIPCRIDVLFGWKLIRPEHVIRVAG